MGNLTLEGEAGADLVAGLVKLLGVERDADAESEALVDLGVVGEREETAVVDLGLFILLVNSSRALMWGDMPWQTKLDRSCTWTQSPYRQQSWSWCRR